MPSITTTNKPACPLFKSLDQRVTALSIKIATDRANAREKLPRIFATWAKENEYTFELDQIQITIEQEWIAMRCDNLEDKTEFVEGWERYYDKLIAEWRADGRI
jgi:recombinational DNA repair ATPase RecF